jgi:hypothetical protein
MAQHILCGTQLIGVRLLNLCWLREVQQAWSVAHARDLQVLLCADFVEIFVSKEI